MAKSVKTIGKSILKFLGWFFNIFMTLALIGIICGLIVGGAFMIYIKNYLDTSTDNFDALAADKNMTTKVSYVRTNDDGTEEIVELVSERLSADENRVWVTYDNFNDYICDAFVAIEDKRFWTHSGVDWVTTAKATISYVTGTGSKGGSTLTQQLIKNITGDDQVTIERKVQEIFRALDYEKKHSKKEILEQYLNNIYLSEGCYGVGAAAYTYFGKEVKELDLVESAAIAAITQNPSYWDPFVFPENNAERRNTIIQEMYDQGKITQEEFASAYGKELKLKYNEEDEEEDDDVSFAIHSWYTDAAQIEAVKLLQEHFGYTASVAEKALLTGGYNIVTAQDPEIQSVAEAYFEDPNSWERVDNSAIQPESACVIINPENGNVLALVGARGQKTINLGLNYATSTLRPAGSAIKPLSVYGPGIEARAFTFASVFDDVPLNFGTKYTDPDTGKTKYTNKHGYPKNSPDKYRGLTNVDEAVTVSINTVAMRALQALGLENSFNFLTEKVGISTIIRSETLKNGNTYSDIALAPLALGEFTWGVTVKELTSGYQIFANGGIYNEERLVLKILDSDGNVVIDNQLKSSIAISAQAASVVTKMLQDVASRGTAKYISAYKKQIDKTNIAGKTGTTDSNRDRWFVGYTPYYVCGVWTGYSNPRSLKKFKAGYTDSVRAWDNIITAVSLKYVDAAKNGGEPLKKFQLAPGVVTAEFCYDSGKLMTDACRADPRGSRLKTGYFISGTEPTEKCDVHVLVNYDASTKSVAAPGCPSSNIKKVGLLNVYREFPFNITVIDSQYTCQILPKGYSYSGLTTSMPYYQNLLPNGWYAGKGSSSGHYNHICVKHLRGSSGENTDVTPDDPGTDIEIIPDIDPELDPEIDPGIEPEFDPEIDIELFE